MTSSTSFVPEDFTCLTVDIEGAQDVLSSMGCFPYFTVGAIKSLNSHSSPPCEAEAMHMNMESS